MDQIGSLEAQAGYTRRVPPRIRVDGAGLSKVNGIYKHAGKHVNIDKWCKCPYCLTLRFTGNLYYFLSGQMLILFLTFEFMPCPPIHTSLLQYATKLLINAIKHKTFSDCESNGLTIFRCSMDNNTDFNWFISKADKVSPGTANDIDFYTAKVRDLIPPTMGWVTCSEGVKPNPVLIKQFNVEGNGDKDSIEGDESLEFQDPQTTCRGRTVASCNAVALDTDGAASG